MVEINLSRLGLILRGACAAAPLHRSNRLLAVVIAGISIASCSTTSTPKTTSTPNTTSTSSSSRGLFDVFNKPKPVATVMLIESNPASAQAKTSFGKTCTTPCTMLIGESTDFTVTFTLAGYVQQTLPVHATMKPGGWSEPPAPTFDPPSLFPTLEKETPPAVARKPSKKPPA
jgi:hypothetical protein